MRHAGRPRLTCCCCLSLQVRCSGQASGCDRCVAVSAECRYPDREARRRKRPTSSRIGTSGTSSRTSSSDLVADGKEQGRAQGQGQDQGQGQSQSHEQGQEQPSAGLVSGQAGRIQSQTAGASVGKFGLEPEPDYGHQQMKHWLSSYSVGDGNSSNGSVRGGLDEWLDMDSFLDPMLTAQLENSNDGVEMVNDVTMTSLFGDNDDLNSKQGLCILWACEYDHGPEYCGACSGHRCELQADKFIPRFQRRRPGHLV